MDFLSANEANLEGVPDPRVLALAAEQDRILVSHDFQTMPRHFGDFLQTRRFGPGVLLVPQRLPIGEAIEELVLFWSASDAEEWRNRSSAFRCHERCFPPFQYQPIPLLAGLALEQCPSRLTFPCSIS